MEANKLDINKIDKLALNKANKAKKKLTKWEMVVQVFFFHFL